MKLKNITPKAFDCGIGACPAIFETTDGDYVIIGQQLPEIVTKKTLAGRVASDETVIKIPRGLLSELNHQSK